jgi:hypothetical protein
MCARVTRVRGASLITSCQLVCLTRWKYPLVVWCKLLLTLSWSCRARRQAMMPSWLLWIDFRKLSVFVLRRRMWMLLGLRSCSSIIGIGTMVSRARLCRTVTGVSLASLARVVPVDTGPSSDEFVSSPANRWTGRKNEPDDGRDAAPLCELPIEQLG